MSPRKIKSLFMALCLTCAGVLAYAQTAEELLPKAIQLEEVKGELEKAIEVYKKIVSDFSDNKVYAAKAHYHMGLCYEKLGKKEAKKAYETVIKNYADQHETVEFAKSRLQRLNTQIASANEKLKPKPISTQIPLDKKIDWNIHHAITFDISPDGRKVVFMASPEEPGENSRIGKVLYTSDITGPPAHYLINPSEFASEKLPRYSPDGNYIAFFGASSISGNKEYSRAIYLVKASGGTPHRISQKLDEKDLRGGLIWHPGGQHISYLNSDGIVTIKLADRTTTLQSMYVDHSTRLSGYSPDGKWISYYCMNKGSDNLFETDCWMISSEGDKHIRLTESKGYDAFGSWSENDYSFYFVSDRNVDDNIFRINIDPLTGEKKGRAEQITHQFDASVSSPLFISNRSFLTYFLVKEIDEIVIPVDGSNDNFKTIVSGKKAILSPDGSTIYYTGAGKNNQGIFSIPRTGGNIQRLTDVIPCTGLDVSSFQTLSPDGSTIAFFTKHSEGRMQLCFLSTSTQKLHRSSTIEIDEPILPAWSPDGKKVTYAYDDGLYTIPVWGHRADKLAEIGKWEPWSIRWSPDGKYIAGFAYMDNERENTIIIVSTQSGEFKRLSTSEENLYKEGLEWHPSSTKLTYMYYDPLNDKDGVREAYIDGRPTTPFINQPAIWDYIGKWDPAGIDYYFIGNSKGVNQLYKYNAPSQSISLFSDNTDISLPIWSSDGKFMIFIKEKSEYQLWMMENLE